jgi:predicted PurR-regulated permease PerM
MKFGRARTAAAVGDSRRREVEAAIPVGVEIAGQWSWRVLAIVGVVAVFIWLVIQLKYIVIPFLIALLIAALLVPLVQFLQRHRWPKWLAIVLALVATIGTVAGLIYLVVWQVRIGLTDLQVQSVKAFGEFKAYLLSSPLQLTDAQITGYIDATWASVQKDSTVLVNGALSVGTTAGHILAGLLLTIFATIFMLIDGHGIWGWVVRIFPRRSRLAVDGAGYTGWRTLTSFVRVQIFVAAVDAVGIGLGAFILHLPLAIPIAIAVFLGSFIPVVGAVATGAIAVFIALVYQGPGIALIMLAIVIVVQQVEGHYLQPFIMGNAVKVHPLAVVFSVAAGGYLAGIPGALFAVPFVAVFNVMVKYIASGSWRSNPKLEAEEMVAENG